MEEQAFLPCSLFKYISGKAQNVEEEEEVKSEFCATVAVSVEFCFLPPLHLCVVCLPPLFQEPPKSKQYTCSILSAFEWMYY